MPMCQNHVTDFAPAGKCHDCDTDRVEFAYYEDKVAVLTAQRNAAEALVMKREEDVDNISDCADGYLKAQMRAEAERDAALARANEAEQQLRNIDKCLSGLRVASSEERKTKPLYEWIDATHLLAQEVAALLSCFPSATPGVAREDPQIEGPELAGVAYVNDTVEKYLASTPRPKIRIEGVYGRDNKTDSKDATNLLNDLVNMVRGYEERDRRSPHHAVTDDDALWLDILALADRARELIKGGT